MDKTTKGLKDILGIDTDFINNSKIHFAISSESEEYGKFDPYDAITNNWEGWKDWNNTGKETHWTNCKYIIHLARTKDDPCIWLFGGILEVDHKKWTFHLIENHTSNALIGKLFVKYENSSRQGRRYAEKIFNNNEIFIERIAETSVLPYDPIEEEKHLLEQERKCLKKK